MPFFAAAANQAWAHIAALASNQFSWLQLAAIDITPRRATVRCPAS